MKKNKFLDWWCFRPWQYALDCLGLVMIFVLIGNWSEWNDAQRMFAMVSALIPLHVFEEWWFPAGFHWQYNLVFGKNSPDCYPMNRLTDMITNTVGTIWFGLLAICNLTSTPFLLMMTTFCFFEVFIHTLLGSVMFVRYKSKGKRTIYGPGSFTAYTGFLALMIYGIILLTERSISLNDVLLALVWLLVTLIGLIVLPERLLRSENTPYKFLSAGYFNKFLDK